jgi:hypothetical protein
MTISPPETQAIVGEPALLGYAALVWVEVAAFVRWYEEPHLLRQRGEGRSGGGGGGGGSVARG